MAVSHKRSFDLPPGDVDRSIFIYCDPADHPYSYRHFREQFKGLEIINKISCFHPIKYSHAWVLTLETPEVKQEVLGAGDLVVNGAYCRIKDASMPEHLITVHWVPMSMTDLTPIKQVFEEYGDVKTVRRVIRQVMNGGRIRIHQREGSDVPRGRSYGERHAVRVAHERHGPSRGRPRATAVLPQVPRSRTYVHSLRHSEVRLVRKVWPQAPRGSPWTRGG
ncbi:hypothetical protein MTO96_028626 [Rhipicephalus appendiculatus]